MLLLTLFCYVYAMPKGNVLYPDRQWLAQMQPPGVRSPYPEKNQYSTIVEYLDAMDSFFDAMPVCDTEEAKLPAYARRAVGDERCEYDHARLKRQNARNLGIFQNLYSDSPVQDRSRLKAPETLRLVSFKRSIPDHNTIHVGILPTNVVTGVHEEPIVVGITAEKFLNDLRARHTTETQSFLQQLYANPTSRWAGTWRYIEGRCWDLAMVISVVFLWFCCTNSSKRKRITSWLIELLRTKPLLGPNTIRRQFHENIMPITKPTLDHTHAAAAADRTSASRFIDRLASLLGRTAYFVQRSHADEKCGRVGNRSFYWTKDLVTKVSCDTVPSAPIMAYVDVDQYIDMNQLLCDQVHPTILYTVQPDRVSKVSDNYSYTFNSDNTIDYKVTGGGSYRHRIWNYSQDHIMVSKTLFGIPYKIATYLVDRRKTCPDHELVMLSPIGSWRYLGALLYWILISGFRLKYLDVVKAGGFTRLMTSAVDGVKISTGRINSYASAYIPASIDDTIAGIARTSAYTLTLPQVLCFTAGDRTAAIALLEFHRSKALSKPDVVCPVEDSVRRYQFKPFIHERFAKPSMVGFMTPLVDGAFAPDRTPGNEECCVEERVLKVKPSDPLPLSIFLVRAMDEFSKMLIPDDIKHTMDPTDDDEVLDRQHKPEQRRLFEVMHGMTPRRVINMFMKAECYAGLKAPRAISVINTVDKREYSRFMYAFEKVLKQQPWYAFSHNPQEITRRVVTILQDAQTAANTDFDKFDGHGSNIMRDLEKQILLRAFRPQYHQELLDLHRSQHNLKAYARFDNPYTGSPLNYQTDFTRASGSPETSLFNTLVNAFVAFLALKMSLVDGIPLSAEQCFERLGIYGGDDGLTADIDPETYQKAATLIGQKLTIEPIARGEPGIKFLARVYSPNVWFGDETTMCDVKRQVVKLHTCVRLNSNVTPQMKLLEKVRGFAGSDINTPIIGDFCKAVIRIHGGPIKENKFTAPMRSWLSFFESTNQYYNDSADWMMDLVHKQLPEFQYDRFKVWCDSLKTLDQALNAPTFMEKIVAIPTAPVVIDGDILPLGIKLEEDLSMFFPKPSSLPPVEVKEKKTPMEIEGPTVGLTDGYFEEQKNKKQNKPKKVRFQRLISDNDYKLMKERKIKEGTWVVQDLIPVKPWRSDRPGVLSVDEPPDVVTHSAVVRTDSRFLQDRGVVPNGFVKH